MKNLNNKSGITLIALVITIIVILILAGISLREGTSLIKKAKMESLMTNMITIKANAKGFAEEINAEIWDLEEEQKATKRAELFASKYHMTALDSSTIESKVDSSIKENGCVAFNITKETIEDMGMSDLANQTENGEFVVVYNSKDFSKLEIVYPSGIPYEKATYWTLSELQNKIEE